MVLALVEHHHQSTSSDTIKVVAEIDGVHIAFGANPAATDLNFYMGIRDVEEINIGRPSSQGLLV